MSIFMLLLCILMMLLFGVYWRCKYSRLAVMCNKLGGPATYPIIGNASVFLGGNYLLGIHRLTTACNSLGRIWMGWKVCVVAQSPEVIEKILSSKAGLDKGYFYEIMRPIFEDGLIASKGSIWQNNRKIIAPTFNVFKIKNYTIAFNQGSEEFAVTWKSKIGQKFSPFSDLDMVFFAFAIRTAVGEDIFKEIIRTIDLKPFVSDMQLVSQYVASRFFNPLLYMDWIFYLTSRGKRVKAILNKFDDLLDTMIRKKTEAKNNDITFLSHVLKAASTSSNFGHKQIRDELKTYVCAGFETTATTTSLIFLMLGIHPEVQEKVFSEQMEILQGRDRLPDFDDLNKMVYLEMVIKETLRIFPTIPIFGRQLTADVKCGEEVIPSGAFVVISPYAVHRSPAVYPDPLIFNPERYLSAEEKNRHPYAFLGFGGGPRSCIGQRYAMLSMKTLISSVIKRYRIHTDEDFDTINMTMKTAIELLVAEYKISLSLRQ